MAERWMSMENRELEPGSVMTPRLIIGLAIALFGLVLVLDRLNLVVADQALQWWPAVIIAIGALIFSQSRRVGGGINGVIVMLVGAWLLLNSLAIIRVRFWEMFWPLVLIGIGSALVLQAAPRRTREVSGADADATMTIFAVLSGMKRTSAAERFRGGEITAFMGGAQIDLRQATIPPGEEAALDIFIVMGGCEIFVPPSWNVVTPLVPIMGGIDDKRLPPLPGSAESGRPAPRLVLRGLIMMGGIEIKS
jgi:predicted membrane protein